MKTCEICGNPAENSYLYVPKFIDNNGWTSDSTIGTFCNNCKEKARNSRDKDLDAKKFVLKEKRLVKLSKLLSQ